MSKGYFITALGHRVNRDPVLSNEDFENMADWSGDSTEQQMRNVRDFYEAKITSGELMAVKTAHVLCSADTGWNPMCSNCQRIIEGSDIQTGEFCRCGAQMVQ